MLRFVSRLLWIGLVFWPLLGNAQARLNLALEPEANQHQPLRLWSEQYAPGTIVGFDSLTVHQGRGSLRVDLPPAEDPAYAQVYTLFSFPIDSVRGHQVTVTGWLRTEDFSGQAGLYAYAHTPDEDGKNRTDNFGALPPAQPWKRVEVSLPVKATATAFGIGLRVRGRGRVWFDDLQVLIDGRVFRDAPQAGTEALLLTPAQLQQAAWDGAQLPPVPARPDAALVSFTLASSQPQQGQQNLRVALARSLARQEPAPVVYLGTLPVAKMRGKLLTVTGYWQQAAAPGAATEASVRAVPVPPEFTYALLGNDGKAGSPAQWSRGVVGLPAPPPGASWTTFTLTIPVPNDEFLYGLSLGLRVGSLVPVQLDDIQFSLDGRPYVPGPALTPAAPTAGEVAWLRKALIPLPLGAHPAASATLEVLGPLVAGARIVGLGEVTHGSGTLFNLKHDLIRYLVERKGFTAVVMETSADCEPLNLYVRTGKGNPAQLLAGLGVWNTQEVLELVRYLRAYNQQHATPVRLAGMDMQRPDLVLARLRQKTPVSDQFIQTRLQELATALAAIPAAGGGPAFDLFLNPSQANDPLLQPVLRLVGELRTGLDTRTKLVPPDAATLTAQVTYLHELRLLEQGAVFRRLPLARGAAYRDACLAENVAWLQQQMGSDATPAKLVVWAHNAHVATSDKYQHPMGEWLKKRFGPAYLAVGLAFGQGTYAAEAGGKFYPAQAQPARAGSYEAWFQASGVPAFALDLRRIAPGKDADWLLQQQLLRDIGIQEAPRNFALHEVAKEFDVLMYRQQSVAAVHLE